MVPQSKPLPALTERKTVIGFLLVPQFSMIAFTSAIEPLRLANRVAERVLYEWRLLSGDGEPVCASNGVKVAVDQHLADAHNVDVLLVCAGLDVQNFDHRKTISALRRLSSFGAMIGALCTGTFVLAKAGLLDGYRCTIHWENHAGLTAAFPELRVSQELYEIDRNRMTCAGGTAALDMVLSLIVREHGAFLASRVSDQLIHHRIRDAHESQRMGLRQRLLVANPKLLAAAALMEKTIERPLACTDIARSIGLSSRQLERLFTKYLGMSPAHHYLGLRLEHARYLLRQTSMPILSVALAAGFVSASHFSDRYSSYFGCTPSAERQVRNPVAGMEDGGRPVKRRKAATL
jgi:AraC family transcriptional regulator, glycine betaine-responsive activator